MKKTTITIATLSLIVTLLATAVGQDRRRAPQPKGMNKADLTEQLSIRSNRQRNRRPTAIGNPIGLGGTVSAGINQTPNQVQRVKRKSPTSTGDQPEMQITNSPQQNLGDTATHEVGHKGNRRRGAIGEGASNVNASVKERTETVDNNEYRTNRPVSVKRRAAGFVSPSSDPHGRKPNGAKFDGIDGESNDARTKNPNQPRKTQNLLPYMEQSNIYKTRNRKR